MSDPVYTTQIYHLGVDSGDSTIILITGGPTPVCVLIDGGKDSKWRTVVAPTLKELATNNKGLKLKAIVVTHPDEDHMKGINDLIVELGFQIGIDVTSVFGGKASDGTANGQTWLKDLLYSSKDEKTRIYDFGAYTAPRAPAVTPLGKKITKKIHHHIIAIILNLLHLERLKIISLESR
jgi:glyoxylase-like metal-dependent hydrolase (beta-lactamase superfamily II)